MLLPLRGVATPGHGEGEGSAGDKFRVSGTQETVEGAGANEVSGVLSEASCCRCGAPLIRISSYKTTGAGVGAADAVEGRGNDATAVAGTFTAWIQTWHRQILKCLGITRDADRTAGTGFNAQQQSIIGVISTDKIVADLRKSIFKTQAHMLRQTLVQRSWHSPRYIT